MNNRAVPFALFRLARTATLLPLAIFMLGAPRPASAAPEPAPTATAAGEEPPVLKAAADVKAITLKRQKNSIGSLLLVQGEAGTEAEYTTISATVQPLAAGAPGELAFDRFLGPLTMKGLDAVLKAVVGLHGGWPHAERITLSFSEKIAPVELGPADLPAALLIDSLVRDWDIDPGYAVIGLLQPDGSIDAVGAIGTRLDGAARGRVRRLVVPEKNQTQVADYLLSAGISAFVGTQIFTAKHYNDAGRLAFTKLDAQTAEAVKLFGTVQRTLSALGAGRSVELLRDARVQATLEKVLAAAPNHLSAQVLRDWGTGQRTQISLPGTMETIDRISPSVLHGFRAKNSEAIALPKDKVLQELNLLRAIRARIDAQARPYLDSLVHFAEVLQKAQAPGGSSKAVQATLDEAREAANQEWVKVVRLRQEAAEKP